MRRYINHTETNKLIRETLKAEFPGVKFTVKKSGGSATNIHYSAPLTVAEVEAVVSIFEGASFDGMQDLETIRTVKTEGEEISYGAKYIFVGRTWDDEEITKFAEYFVTTHQWYDFHDNKLDTTPTYEVKNGRVIADRDHFISKRDLNEMVWRTAKDYRTFADFMADKEYERMWYDALYDNRKFDEAKKEAQETLWDNALEEVQAIIEQPEISDYEAMLLAAGWIS